MKSHPASKPSATGPVTGHSGEVSAPEMSTPPRPLKTDKVDAPDMSLPLFMEYLVASVARVRPGFGRQTLDCHARAFRSGKTGVEGEFDIAALAEAFVYDLERQAEHLVLVIDDLHLIYDSDWIVSFFHRLPLLLPAKTHMLILGQGLPPEPIWRLRPKQRLFVITEQMLAFTQTEAEGLF